MSLEEHRRITQEHINEVRKNINIFLDELSLRAKEHDKSKLESPEAEILAANNHLLSMVKYGTPAYEELKLSVKPALDHHYANNRHHPEYFKNGVDDMTLVDILEMLSDWKASTQRMKEGNIRYSIDANAVRFNISPQLARILHNTITRHF